MVTKLKGILIELSTSNRNTSTLSEDEFLTVYTIINDINLPNLQCMMSLAYLNSKNSQTSQYGYTNYIPPVSTNQQPMYMYGQQPYTPQTVPPYTPQVVQQPRVGRTISQTNNNQYKPQNPQFTRNPGNPDIKDIPEKNNGLPPRDTSSIFDKIEKTDIPVSPFSYDDDIDGIFN